MKVHVKTTNIGPTNQDTRDFARFSEVAQEVVDARILLGIRFRFADEASRGEESLRLGQQELRETN